MKRTLLLEYRNYNTGALRKTSGARPFSAHQFRFELERFLNEPVDRPSQRDLINLDYSLYSDIYFFCFSCLIFFCFFSYYFYFLCFIRYLLQLFNYFLSLFLYIFIYLFIYSLVYLFIQLYIYLLIYVL